MKWQQIGNRKSASQNNICNRNKITAKKDIKLKQIYLRISLDLPSLNNRQKTSDAHFTRVSEVSLCLLDLFFDGVLFMR